MGGIQCKDQRKEEKLSEEDRCILEFVQEQIRTADCGFIPDVVEKRIYINLLKLLLATTKNILNGVRLEVLNHVITIHIDPIIEKNDVHI